jgi:hypothetical protein
MDHATEFDEIYRGVSVIYDSGYLTIRVDEHGRCSLERTRALAGLKDEYVPYGDSLGLDELRPLVYRALDEAVEEAELRDADQATVPPAPAVVYPRPETREDWYRGAYAEGLAPMALRLAIERIAFVAGRFPSGHLVLHIPVSSAAYIWISGAENTPADHLDELRWHLWWYGADEEEDILGDTVTTEDAVNLVTSVLAKAKGTHEGR